MKKTESFEKPTFKETITKTLKIIGDYKKEYISIILFCFRS